MITRLTSIPRIGEKTALRFIKHFGSEENALKAILSRNIAAVKEIEGMTEKSALSLILEAVALNEGAAARDFLKTGEAYELYEQVMEIIKGFAHTDYARSMLNFYYPYPSNKKDKIIKMQREIESIIEIANKLDEKKLSSLLSKVKPVKTNISIPAIRERVIVATNNEDYEAAKKFPVSVQLVSDAREAIDVSRGYSYIIASTSLAGMDFPDGIEVDFLDIKKAEIWQIAPEKELFFFAKNLESINNAIEVMKLVRQQDLDFCEKIKNEAIERLSSGLNRLSKDADLKRGIDEEIDRLRTIYDRLNDVITNAERQANLEFSALIEKSSVTVKGFDLLTAMDGSISGIFEKEIREKYNSVAADALRKVIAELGLAPREAQLVSNIFSEEISHPIKVNQRGVDELRNYLQRSIASRKFALLRESARELSALKEAASLIVHEVLEFDIGYTIACFAGKYSLSMPFMQESKGIGIAEGRNLFLEAPEPVNYAVGTSRFNSKIGKLKDACVVLLSGVNSGGKTSTLELLAQVVILAHMGFPVPAKQSEISLVEEFYYFGKSKGTMDAGAFESTINEFSAVANNKSKIVLADELESITEPGASAKIISGILEELEDNNGMAVFVSHLAEAVLKNTNRDIRVDGIEAKGLDEHHNLIVDRNPRYNYLARSTPELIVERLARKNRDNAFYERMLKKFK